MLRISRRGNLLEMHQLEFVRKLTDVIKKLLTQEVNEGVEHDLNSKVWVITKRLDKLQDFEKEIALTIKDTDKTTHNFFEDIGFKVNMQERLYRGDKFLQQKLTVLSINDEHSV